MKRLLLFASLIETLLLAGFLLFVSCHKFEYEEETTNDTPQTTNDTTGTTRALTDPHLTLQTVSGKKRIYWSDGIQATLSHADSPESGLHPSYQSAFAAVCTELPARGINAITVTLRGDDVTSIFPWTSSGTRTPDRAKHELWKSQFQVFIQACKERNLRPIIICYIGERTNFSSITLAQYTAWLDVFADVMKTGDDITGNLILGIEEVGQNMSNNQVATWWNPLNAVIKARMPRCLTMLHNNPGKKFWQATSPALQVDVINVQETTIGNMETTANDALNRGYAIHLHEWYGAIKASQSDATNISKLNQQLAVSERTGCRCSGIFASDYDTQRPDVNKLRNVHTAQGNYFYGSNPPPPPPDDDTVVTPPPTGILTIEYSTRWDKSSAQTLTEGATLPQGSYWIFVRTGTAPLQFTLTKGGTAVRSTTDSSAPYDLNGNNNQYLQRGYTYRLTVRDGSGQSVAINFTVI